MELSPRTTSDKPGMAAATRRRRPWAYGVLALVLVGLGVVVYQGLTSASLYFYNADEASEQRVDLGSQRIRLQGSVRDDVTPLSSGQGIEFTVSYNGVDVVVQHDGDPPELFKPGVPVVLEGQWMPARVAMLRFPSVEAAKAFYDGEMYRAARATRAGTTEFFNMIVVEGVPGPV